MKALNAEFFADEKRGTIIAVVCAVCIVADVVFVVRPQLAALKKTQVKAAQVKKDVDQFSQETAQLRLLQQNYKKAEGSADPKELITEGQLLGFLERVSKLARRNQVVVNQIQPVKQVPAPSKTQPAAAQPAMTTLSVEMELTSGFHNLGYFISDLENDDVFMAVTSLRLTSAPDQSRHKSRLVIQTYLAK